MNGPPWPGFGDCEPPPAQQERLDAQEELTLTRLQLQQVQDELEHYFLESLALERQVARLETQRTQLLHQVQRQNGLLRRVMALATRAPQQL